MDTTTAFENIRQALATVVALQPGDGRASRRGTSLTVRLLDGSAFAYHFQHVTGGTMRAVRTELEGFQEVARTVTPLDTEIVVSDYLRAMLVEVLR